MNSNIIFAFGVGSLPIYQQGWAVL